MKLFTGVKHLRKRGDPAFGLLLKILLCVIVLIQVAASAAYADTFVGPSAITINGTFTDWGTTGTPIAGVFLFQDASNYGEQDGSGFSGKASDLNYLWTGLSTLSGGTAPASPSNPIQNFYYRFDTREDSTITGQSYYIQLNLGVASPGYADHLLQVWVNNSSTPKVTLVLYQYNTPYPQIRSFTSGSIVGRVSNVAHPYPGFAGVQDTSATGALGKYDGTNYGIEIKIPANWYSSTYGGAVAADGTGAPTMVSAVFTGTGSLGAVGTVKDTLNDSGNKTRVAFTSTITGDTVFVTNAITKLVFTTAAQTLVAGQVSGIITVQTQDATGAPRTVSSATTINLSSTSTGGRFDTSAGGPFNGSITSVTIPAGSSTASFYYRDSRGGTPTITAAESPGQGWTDATQQETITSFLPTGATNNATLVEETAATLHGTLLDDGAENCQYRFEYGTNSGAPYSDNTSWSGSITTGQSFSANLTGLTQGTKYYFRAQVKNSTGATSGIEMAFLTKPEAPAAFSGTPAGSNQINLAWTKGAGANRTIILRKTGSYPAERNDGVQVYFNTGTGFNDAGLSPNTAYYYKAWSEVTNGSQQWSDGFATATATTGVAPTPTPTPTITPTPTLPPPVAVGGIIYPVDKARLLASWLSFFTLSLATLGGFFVLKKLRI